MSEVKTIKELIEMGVKEEDIIKTLIEAGMDEEDANLLVAIETGELPNGDVIEEGE